MTKRDWTTEDLLAYAAGDLTPEEAQGLEGRIGMDATARRMIEHYRSVAHLVRTDDSVEPPARTSAAVRALFERYLREREAASRTRRPTWLDRLDALIGELLFDSRLQPIAVRRRHAAEFVQLAYRAGDDEVELRATWSEGGGAEPGAGGGRWRILGQISPPAGDGDVSPTCPPRRIALVLTGGDAVVTESVCDETGMFALEAEPGTYDLCMCIAGSAGSGGERLVVLPGIDLP